MIFFLFEDHFHDFYVLPKNCPSIYEKQLMDILRHDIEYTELKNICNTMGKFLGSILRSFVV